MLTRFLTASLLLLAAMAGTDSSAAAQVGLARVDSKLIKSSLPRSDLEVTEDATSPAPWDDPECREQRSFDVWQNQTRYATYWVWLCHSGVLGLEGFDETVKEALQNLGHGDPNQPDRSKEAEGWNFDIGSRKGRTILVVNTIVSGGAAAVHFLAVAAIRSRDETLNLAVVTDGVQHGSAQDPASTESLKTVEKILRAVDAVTPAAGGR